MRVGYTEQPEICIVAGINIQNVGLIDTLVDLDPVEIARSVAYKVLVSVGVVEDKVGSTVDRCRSIIGICLVCQSYCAFVCKISPDGYPVVGISCSNRHPASGCYENIPGNINIPSGCNRVVNLQISAGDSKVTVYCHVAGQGCSYGPCRQVYYKVVVDKL